MSQKERLDIAVHRRGLTISRAKAQGMIMAGEVSVNGAMVDKPGFRVSDADEITLKSKPAYVSRGGDKLAGALRDFTLDVTARICADVGASTGGFTDCLLQHGASRVYALDVGYGILDYTLRADERVIVMERTNARHVERLAEPVDLVVVDASFISLKLLLPAIKGWLTPQADLVTLIKPQFEAGKSDVGKGGVVRSGEVHARVIREVIDFALSEGLALAGLTTSPIKGPAGNVEFLAWFAWGYQPPPCDDLDARIATMTGIGGN
ncbi:MAG: TlyA family RNA methyltransferase [Anaerolineaceae bacterium]|nr:MAG: TlyA family RNA methyltransferase [Anaerolineaceae bacterium]